VALALIGRETAAVEPAQTAPQPRRMTGPVAASAGHEAAQIERFGARRRCDTAQYRGNR